jgi:hypothetical protein
MRCRHVKRQPVGDKPIDKRLAKLLVLPVSCSSGGFYSAVDLPLREKTVPNRFS